MWLCCYSVYFMSTCSVLTGKLNGDFTKIVWKQRFWNRLSIQTNKQLNKSATISKSLKIQIWIQCYNKRWNISIGNWNNDALNRNYWVHNNEKQIETMLKSDLQLLSRWRMETTKWMQNTLMRKQECQATVVQSNDRYDPVQNDDRLHNKIRHSYTAWWLLMLRLKKAWWHNNTAILKHNDVKI